MDTCESGVALRFPPQSKTFGEAATCLAIPVASWSAPAERSGDGAFVRTKTKRTCKHPRPHESGAEATALSKRSAYAGRSMHWSAGLRPGSFQCEVLRAGSETGAPSLQTFYQGATRA
jgi:hypothetical protein